MIGVEVGGTIGNKARVLANINHLVLASTMLPKPDGTFLSILLSLFLHRFPFPDVAIARLEKQNPLDKLEQMFYIKHIYISHPWFQKGDFP